MVNVGVCFDRLLPAPFVVDVAEVLEAADVDQLWVIDDCFYWGGMSLAATALARTERLTVLCHTFTVEYGQPCKEGAGCE